MAPVISFVGFSGSGKTSLLEKVVEDLKARGYRVGVVKHASHRAKLDHPGKDSWRLARAGADMLALASPGQTVLVEQREAPPEDIMTLFQGKVDVVLTEGYKWGPFPKVLVCRDFQPCLPLLWQPEELLAIMTPLRLPHPSPQFHTYDTSSLVELILRVSKEAPLLDTDCGCPANMISGRVGGQEKFRKHSLPSRFDAANPNIIRFY